MAYYAYKRVRDLLPQHIIDKQEQPYEGDPGMDGDQWYAAADYIEELQAEKAALIKWIEEQRPGYSAVLLSRKGDGV